MENKNDSKKKSVLEEVGLIAQIGAVLIETGVETVAKKIGEELHIIKKEPGFLEGLGEKSDRKGILDSISDVQKGNSQIKGNPLDFIAEVQTGKKIEKSNVVDKIEQAKQIATSKNGNKFGI